MPNEDVAFEGVYWPKKENGSLCEFSDVWEAREGATESLETAPLAYLRAIVTDVDEGWYRIQDAYNHNCNNDELKKYNGILVHASSDGLQVGDNVYLCGYPNLYEWYEGTVVLSDVRVLRKGNYGYIEHAYPTTLAGIVEDYYGSGHSSAKDSRLQDRQRDDGCGLRPARDARRHACFSCFESHWPDPKLQKCVGNGENLGGAPAQGVDFQGAPLADSSWALRLPCPKAKMRGMWDCGDLRVL